MDDVFEDLADDELIEEVYESMKDPGNAQERYRELGHGLSIESADYPYQEKIRLAQNVVLCLVASDDISKVEIITMWIVLIVRIVSTAAS